MTGETQVQVFVRINEGITEPIEDIIEELRKHRASSDQGDAAKWRKLMESKTPFELLERLGKGITPTTNSALVNDIIIWMRNLGAHIWGQTDSADDEMIDRASILMMRAAGRIVDSESFESFEEAFKLADERCKEAEERLQLMRMKFIHPIDLGPKEGWMKCSVCQCEWKKAWHEETHAPLCLARPVR